MRAPARTAPASPPPAEPARPAGGLFVCLEGIDGAGKTTAADLASRLLRERGLAVESFDKKKALFGSQYVRRHMAGLREVIWGHPADDPYLELGDWHWIYLQAAWYSAASRCAVQPLTEAGFVVLTDTWLHKFLAKLALRPHVDLDRARAVFADLVRPDLVIQLDLDPATAAARKASFGISEAGNHEGSVELSTGSFVAYQRRLSAVLDEWGQAEYWLRLDVNALAPEEVAAQVAELVARRLPGAARAGGGG